MMTGDAYGVGERDDSTSHGHGFGAPPWPIAVPRRPPPPTHPPPPTPLLCLSLVLPALPLACALLCVSMLIVSIVIIFHGLRSRILIFIVKRVIHVVGRITREQQAYQEGLDQYC